MVENISLEKANDKRLRINFLTDREIYANYSNTTLVQTCQRYGHFWGSRVQKKA